MKKPDSRSEFTITMKPTVMQLACSRQLVLTTPVGTPIY